MYCEETLDFLLAGVASFQLSLRSADGQGLELNTGNFAEQAIEEVANVGAAVQLQYPHPSDVHMLEGRETRREAVTGKAGSNNICQRVYHPLDGGQAGKVSVESCLARR